VHVAVLFSNAGIRIFGKPEIYPVVFILYPHKIICLIAIMTGYVLLVQPSARNWMIFINKIFIF